jgi:hypothetical protein
MGAQPLGFFAEQRPFAGTPLMPEAGLGLEPPDMRMIIWLSR